MPYTISTNNLFTGATTVAGATTIGLFTLANLYGGAPNMYQDGAGHLRITTGGLQVAYLHDSTSSAVECDTGVIDTTGDSAQGWAVYGHTEPAAAGNAGYLLGYRATFRADNGGFTISKCTSSNNIGLASLATPPMIGSKITIRLEIDTSVAGQTTLRASMWDKAVPGTVYRTSAIDTSTSYTAISNWAIGTNDHAVPGTWAMEGMRTYQFVADVAPPTFNTSVVKPSGYQIDVAFADASVPLLPSTNPTGFSFQKSANGTTWANITVSSVGITQATDLVLGISTYRFSILEQILSSDSVRFSYSGGNVTDSSVAHNPLANFSYNVNTITNNSMALTTSSKGVMILGSGGFDGISKYLLFVDPITGISPPGYIPGEYQSLSYSILPYGASSGWTIPFQGYTDGTTESFNVLGAAVWVTNPGENVHKQIITFNSLGNITITPQSLNESDPIFYNVLPGGVVQVATWYASTVNGGFPYSTIRYVNSLLTSTNPDNSCGVLYGAIGSLSSSTLIDGNFLHGEGGNGPTGAGVGYGVRMYQNLGIFGKPHSSFTGNEECVIFIGDSINIFQIDVDSTRPYGGSGWNGRFAKDDFPYIISGKSGANAGNFLTHEGDSTFIYLYGDNINKSRKVTHACNEYGINSMRNLNSLTDITTNDVNLISESNQTGALLLKYGIHHVRTTLTPMNVLNPDGSLIGGYLIIPSTGTYTNQQLADGFRISRAKFNDYVRAHSNNITGCLGYWDIGGAIENGVDTNIFTANTAFDAGLHPNAVGHIAMSSIPNSTIFASNPNTIHALSVLPTINITSSNQILNVGDTLTLTSGATGTPSPTGQWFKGVSLISGATGNTYNKSNVQTTDSGSYTFVATNSAGTVTSSAYLVTVNAIVVVTPPNNNNLIIKVNYGTNIVVTVSVDNINSDNVVENVQMLNKTITPVY